MNQKVRKPIELFTVVDPVGSYDLPHKGLTRITVLYCEKIVTELLAQSIELGTRPDHAVRLPSEQVYAHAAGGIVGFHFENLLVDFSGTIFAW